MGLPFVFPCTAIVVFSLAGMAIPGRATGAESGAAVPAKKKEVPDIPVGLSKQKERNRTDAVEHAVAPDLQSPAAREEAQRSRREEADQRARAFLFLLQVLRSPK